MVTSLVFFLSFVDFYNRVIKNVVLLTSSICLFVFIISNVDVSCEVILHSISLTFSGMPGLYVFYLWSNFRQHCSSKK